MSSKKYDENCTATLCEIGYEDQVFSLTDEEEKDVKKPALLLHSCCGPCSTAVVESLVKSYQITVYYYNPNITDEKEYRKRRDVQAEFIGKFNSRIDSPDHICFIEGEYDRDEFFTVSKGMEDAPEGGVRCIECFRLRLEHTAMYAMLHGFDVFTTTLSISPHKDHESLRRIGGEIALRYGLVFLDEDFSRSYQRSVELSKLYGLYRQKFCGCDFAR